MTRLSLIVKTLVVKHSLDRNPLGDESMRQSYIDFDGDESEWLAMERETEAAILYDLDRWSNLSDEDIRNVLVNEEIRRQDDDYWFDYGWNQAKEGWVA